MMRRPPGEGTVANKLVLAALVLFFVPWLVDAQQQHPAAGFRQRERYDSPRESVGTDVLSTLEATRLAQKTPKLETPLTSDRRKSTLSSNIKNNNNIEYDASAIATLAPADNAVRAPPRRSSTTNAGLTSQQTARSLEDWEVEDFVLLATVDGKLYARDRKNGKERWTLEVDKPMVETIYYRRNRSVVEEDYRPVDDYLWIVEPSRDGSLFVYVPGGIRPGLVNTGLTIKKLVEEMAPYADEDPPVVYTGDKKTTMVTLDARSGRVLKWFGSGGALINDDQSCVRDKGFLDPDGEECSSSGTITLGRTEYTVGIQGKDGHQIATLKYSEWGPNNYDQDLQRQYRTTLDSKYVLSSHDGSIFAYDHGHSKDRNRLFNQKFSSPVVRVFDIARPWGSESNDPELIVLPQPVPPMEDDDHLAANMRGSKIFLNHTEDGSWYAMSGTSYPLVIDGSERAQCDRRDWWQDAPLWEDLNDAQLSKVLVGLHSIDTARPDRLLTIAPPIPEDKDNDTNTSDITQVEADVPSVFSRISRLPKNAVTSIVDLVQNPIITIIIISLLLVYNKELTKWAKSGYKTKVRPLLEPIVVDQSVPQVPAVAQPENVEPVVEKEIEPISRSETPVPIATELTAPNSPENAADAALKANEAGEENAAPKKRTHRGKRGGVKHKKGSRNLPDNNTSTVEDAVRDAKKLGEEPAIEPDVVTLPNGVAEVSGPILRMNSLEVNTEKLIGTGSNGTMVFEGKFDGRDVAVKRMLIQFFDIASQETKLLRESDDHPNVIRYFAQQQSAGFLYIALELCPASLADVIEKPQLHRDLAQAGERDLPNVLYQITNGLQHLHNLRIVHRDLKPQNILVAQGKDGRPRLLVSDFGLCKKLEGEQSSFRATTAHAAGTSGWRAPELLLDDDIKDGSVTAIDASTHSGSGSLLLSPDLMPNRRATRAIDIFSLGLVFFYVLTKGSHPFDCGDRYMREVNIRKGNFNLKPLEVLGDYAYEAKDLIASMLEADPKRRPSALQVMSHPFFWPAKKRLNFLCDVSDHFEKEPRDPPSEPLQELEKWAPDVCRGDFLKPLGKEFVDSLGKQRKYTGTRLLDLLRALRNKRNHYEDMSDSLKKLVGPLPEGYLSFWTRRFPNLLITCWSVVYEIRWDEEDRFLEYYAPANL